MSGFLAGTKFLNMLLSNEAFTQKNTVLGKSLLSSVQKVRIDLKSSLDIGILSKKKLRNELPSLNGSWKLKGN